jgi:hypothetical protein
MTKERRSQVITNLMLGGLAAFSTIGLTGCFIKPVPLTVDEVRSRVTEDRAVLTQDQEPLSGPMDLYEAMARALKYNLDARVELMHNMLSQTQLDYRITRCYRGWRQTQDSTAAVIFREGLRNHCLRGGGCLNRLHRLRKTFFQPTYP